MTYKYLYPFRKRVEILAAFYAGGFGIYILLMGALSYQSPIYWLPQEYQETLAHFMIIASCLHSTGVAVNGNWKFSPVLRILGLSMHASVMATFVLAGNFSSASYTYMWIFAALLYGVVSGMKDLFASLKPGF